MDAEYCNSTTDTSNSEVHLSSVVKQVRAKKNDWQVPSRVELRRQLLAEQPEVWSISVCRIALRTCEGTGQRRQRTKDNPQDKF